MLDFAGFFNLFQLYLTGFGGERGIRTPGPVTVNGFQDRRIRPLCHLSAAKVRVQIISPKFLQKEIKMGG